MSAPSVSTNDPTLWSVVWITGASSGIGEAVARKLARSGVKVAISARSKDKLEAIAADEPNISAFPVDVTNAEAMAETVDAIEHALGPIELALFNAGAWFPGQITNLKLENYRKTFEVNVIGVMNGMKPVIDAMKPRARGHIAVVASVAGYSGLPNAGAYGPTKAALINMAEAARLELKNHFIDLTVVNPGFVKTPMTESNKFPMPYIMEVDEAADAMIAGLKKRKFEVAFPWQLVTILKILRLLPYSVYHWIIKRTVLKT